LRILFFIENLWIGGTQRRLVELIGFLKQRTDCEIAVVITENDINIENIVDIGVSIHKIPRKWTKYDPSLYFRLNKICRQFNPDIIHTWGIMTTFYAIPIKLLQRVPLIASIISDTNKRFKRISLKNFFFQTDLYFSDQILSNSEAGLYAYRINSSKAKVIYNGLHPGRFDQPFDSMEIRKEIGITDKFVVIMVASFTDYKDYNLFVNVAKGIAEIRNDTKFVAIGDGPQRILIQKRIEDEKINNVLLLGQQKKVEKFIAASDIGLMCTYSEGISNAIIEYMALGKPVICTDLYGGRKEIVIDGKTGYCIDRNVEQTVSAINNLLNDETLRLLMGSIGRERINSNFSFDKFGNEFVTVYHNAMTKN
jgi:glycosyltransferase involved in cell wall biosynthesis